ncbi:UNVERIFIED_ORG: transposase-like protein [Rhizobium sophorae]|nr:transposase-like protein [Rhizobium leguminosarum]MDH6663575.1 transposase-like protein [Rhizobium sophorae]
MSEMMLATLSNIWTVEDMVAAFRDEEHCRRLLESIVWPDARVCPACGYKRSIAIAGDMGKRRARPGLYQCSSGDCRFQFTVTRHTPLHATKLPLRVWLKAMWLLLQSDKGLSSVRLAETLGVSQPTAWRIGHALQRHSWPLAKASPHTKQSTTPAVNISGMPSTLTQLKGSMLGSAEPSQVFFITSAQNLPTYISTKSVSAGPSALLPDRLCEKAEAASKA